MKKQKSEYSIQTVTNALKLLEAFRDEEELGVTELSCRLDLHKNNVFRLLATLELQGYIEQSAFSDRQVVLLEIFAEHVASAITNARLHERERERARLDFEIELARQPVNGG